MSDSDNTSELIPRYLNRQLSGDELAAFEEELSRNEDLRSEVLELSRIYIGMHVADHLELEHVPSNQLALYAENPGRLEGNERRFIEAHVESCPECREELDLCRESIREVKRLDFGSSESFVSKLLRTMFQPRYMVRPVYVYVATLLIAVFGYYGFRHLSHPIPGMAVFELDPSAVRGEVSQNTVTIEEGTAVVRLEFRIVMSGDFYDLQISRSDGTVVFSKPHNTSPGPSRNDFAFEVPASYLPDERYVLTVIETDSAGARLDSRAIEFEIVTE